MADHPQQPFELVERSVRVGCFPGHLQQLTYHSCQGQPGSDILRHQLQVAVGGCGVRESISGEEFRHLLRGKFRGQQQVFGPHVSGGSAHREVIAILTCISLQR